MKNIKCILMITLCFSVSFAQKSSVTIGGSGSAATSAHITIDTDGYKCSDIYHVQDGATLTIWDPVATCSATFLTPEINIKQGSTDIIDGGGDDFGSKSLNTNEFHNFTIENTGTADLTIITPLIIGGADNTKFQVSTQPSSSTITVGGTTTFQLRFQPTTGGFKSASISIANNDSDENPYDIALTGTGLEGEMDLKQGSTYIPNKGSYDFSNRAIGSNTDVIFTIENPGTDEIGYKPPYTISGTDASQFDMIADPVSPTAAGGGTQDFTLRFTPTSLGAKTAMLSISNNDLDENPYELNLTGTGVTPEIDLKQGAATIPDGGNYDYGSNFVGINTDVVFTIENTGTSNLTLTTPLTLSGTNASEFSIQAQPSSPITASSTTTFTVRFSPTSTGAKTAIIAIPNDDGDENPYDITFTGKATEYPYILISGYIKMSDGDPLEGVYINFSNSDRTDTTDVDGYYRRYITKGWNGVVTPSITGLFFTPSSITYSVATTMTDLPNQNYIGEKDHITISGFVRDLNNVPIDGVAVAFSNGGATILTSESGYYLSSFTNGWNGTSIATKDGWTFAPVSYEYPHHVTTDLTDQDYVGTEIALGLEDYISTIPEKFIVLPAFPNPFNPTTNLRYGLDKDSHITIEIYDISGKLISTLLNMDQPQGWHSVNWNGTNQQGTQVPAGLYLSRIISGKEVKTFKLMLLK